MITFTMVVLGFVFAALCAFLILLVLIQPGKSSGGGIGGLGGGAAGAIGETLGATQGEKTLSKWTSIGMAAFFGLCLLLTVLGNLQHSSQLDLGGTTEGLATEAAPESGAAPAGETAPVTPAE
ncbi:MAG: Preprotein translocase SecG subunit [Candidatus Sumerlaeota bacterium]|nr:Preprotein translocase SecG subunit [Candidatus Sumerlaeota bacterium]